MNRGILVWFALSLLCALAWDALVRLRVKRMQLPMSRWLMGLIGYKEWIYVQSRKVNNDSVGSLPWISLVLYLNAIAASIVLIRNSP